MPRISIPVIQIGRYLSNLSIIHLFHLNSVWFHLSVHNLRRLLYHDILPSAPAIRCRFGGGIKQLEPVGQKGEIIMDYSIYDAIQAGFDKVVFVIRKDLEEDFR